MTAQGESVEAIRRRSRHRLMGSVVLVFVAVVAFPLLFDSQPRPVAVDTPILIPDRQHTTPLSPGAAVPVLQTPAKPLLPAASATVPAQASLESGKEEVVSPSVQSEPQAAQVSASHAASTAPAKVAPPPAATSPATESKDKPAGNPAGDAQKAQALLEGRNAQTDHSDKVVIQVGAFTDAEKIREVRRKLEQAGLKTYTQTVDGKDGKRTTRVRVGPFDSRAEADKAAARVRKLDLPANLINL